MGSTSGRCRPCHPPLGALIPSFLFWWHPSHTQSLPFLQALLHLSSKVSPHGVEGWHLPFPLHLQKQLLGESGGHELLESCCPMCCHCDLDEQICTCLAARRPVGLSVLSCLVLSCLALPCLALPCLALPCLVLSCLVLSVWSVWSVGLSVCMPACLRVCLSVCLSVCKHHTESSMAEVPVPGTSQSQVLEIYLKNSY